MPYYIIKNDRFRMWVFQKNDKERAYRFASMFNLEVKPENEIPFCIGITVYP